MCDRRIYSLFGRSEEFRLRVAESDISAKGQKLTLVKINPKEG
jgi:hypothetical protein